MERSFVKYHGAGNDFLLFDDRAATFPVEEPQLIRLLCHRRHGVGADGVILLQNSSRADFRMRIFNADGGEPSMCGNGIRCLVHFLSSLGIKQESYSIETMHAEHLCRLCTDGRVSVSMGAPRILHQGLSVLGCSVDVIDTGVPHAVLFVSDLQGVDVEGMGRAIRTHPLFQPEGVNVNFALVSSKEEVRLRTYERGVEAETLACGTGTAAVAVAAISRFGCQSPLRLLPLSEEPIEIRWEEEIEMIGPATAVFQGTLKEILNFKQIFV